VARRRKRRLPAAVQLPATADDLRRELEAFRKDAEEAAQFFFAHRAINDSARAETRVLHLLNTAPLFWKTVDGALSAAAFIALGRVFDQDSEHNIGKLMSFVTNNRQLFSKAVFAQRRQGANSAPPRWLASYLTHVYVPTVADFSRLRGHVSKWRKVWRHKYEPIRHQVFAHSGATPSAALTANTKIREVERMLVFLMSLHDALWQLLENGRKPSLPRYRYAGNLIRDRAARKARGRKVHERLVYETWQFFDSVS
jgi:hypothetical protein